MRLMIVVTALAICGVGLISVSVWQAQVLEVNPGDSVSLTCPNFSGAPSQNSWFGIKHQQFKPGQMLTFLELVKNYSLFSNSKFEVSSNLTTVSLKINQVNSSDAGFYFCGYQDNKSLVIMRVTHLRVQDHSSTISVMILGGLIIFLMIVIIDLAVRIKKLQGARAKEQRAHQTELQTQDSDVTYASVSLHPKTKPVQRPPSEGLDTDLVVYSNIREKVEAEAATGKLK